MIATCRRFASLEPHDRRLLVEAAVLLALAWVGLWTVRFTTFRKILDRYARTVTRKSSYQAHEALKTVGPISWAISAVATRLPVFATCLVKALAADVMLRRRGYPSELRFGIRERAGLMVPIEAHAWVECCGQIVVGNVESLPDYAVLAAPERS